MSQEEESDQLEKDSSEESCPKAGHQIGNADESKSGRSEEWSQAPVENDSEEVWDAVIPEEPKSAEEQKEEDSRIRAESLKMAGSFGNFGLFLVIAVVFGYVIGRWCDGYFGTKPWMTVFWVVCAVIASVMEFVKNVKKAQKFGDK